MTVVGNITGNLTIGESGAPDLNFILSKTTPEIKLHNSGKITLSASSSDTAAIGFGVVTKPTILMVRARDASDSSARMPRLTITVGAATFELPESSLTIMIGGAAPNDYFASIFVTADGQANDIIVDYLVAGTE